MFLGVAVEGILRGLFSFNCSKGAQTGLGRSLAGGGHAGWRGRVRRLGEFGPVTASAVHPAPAPLALPVTGSV